MAFAQPIRLAISPGDHGDLDSVMELMSDAFGSRYGEAWSRSQCAGILPMAGIELMLAVEDGGDALGFSLSRTIANESELLLIAVARHHQGRGIGKSLLAEFLDRALRSQVSRVHLEVRDGNPAVALYKTAGFIQVGRRKRYYRSADGQTFDALTFARDMEKQGLALNSPPRHCG